MDKEQLMHEAHRLHMTIMDMYRRSTGRARQRLAWVSHRTVLRYRRRRIAWMAERAELARVEGE